MNQKEKMHRKHKSKSGASKRKAAKALKEMINNLPKMGKYFQPPKTDQTETEAKNTELLMNVDPDATTSISEVSSHIHDNISDVSGVPEVHSNMEELEDFTNAPFLNEPADSPPVGVCSVFLSTLQQ